MTHTPPTTHSARLRHSDNTHPSRTRSWVQSVLATVLSVANVVLYFLLAAGTFMEQNMPGIPAVQTWACVAALAMTATVLLLAYRPIVDGPGRPLAFIAGGIAALSPLVGYLIHTSN